MALVGHFCSPSDFLLLGFQKVLVRRYQLVNEFCWAQRITHTHNINAQQAKGREQEEVATTDGETEMWLE